MPEEYRNLYKTYRRTAGFTQEAAAERLEISVESLRAYETGQRVPPNEVVEHMAGLYGATRLAYLHLRETNSLFVQVMPPVEERDLLEVAVRICNRMRPFTERRSVERLLEIAEDHTVDKEEEPEFQDIAAELWEIARSGLELQMHRNRTSVG